MMEIIIIGKPIAKKRPRFARRGKFTVTYSDQETEEGKFYLDAKSQAKERLEGPLCVNMAFFLPRPKGHYGTGKNSGVLKASAPIYPVSKPDRDNLEKFASDCLNGLAWRDDSQIVDGRCRKLYEDHIGPRTEITIEAMEG